MAAAACADSDGAPPPELTLAWKCKQWETLPKAGGLEDQPAGLLSKMQVALNVYEAMREWSHETNQARWAQGSPEKWGIVARVLAMRFNE